MKRIALLIVVMFGMVLFYASIDLPTWADPESPASTHVAKHYVEKIYEETSVPNLVTAVLADYRGYDTMFETVVVFTAAFAIILLLRPYAIGKLEEDLDPSRIKRDLINETACRLLIPPMQLFALYVIAHGHHSPGGGFQGGVVLAASLILVAITFDLRRMLDGMPEKRYVILIIVGVVIFAGVGLGSMLMGANFLDYAEWGRKLSFSPIFARSLGMLVVEIGVAFTVTAALFSIFVDLATRGKVDRGMPEREQGGK